MARRKLVKCVVVLSVKPGITATQARRELRTRVNELCCHTFEEEDVRVRSAKGAR